MRAGTVHIVYIRDRIIQQCVNMIEWSREYILHGHSLTIQRMLKETPKHLQPIPLMSTKAPSAVSFDPHLANVRACPHQPFGYKRQNPQAPCLVTDVVSRHSVPIA